MLCILLHPAACLQSVSQQLRELLLSTPTSAAWLTRVEQQQQTIAEQQDRLHALSCFAVKLATVVIFCSGNTDMIVTVRRMADIGRSLLVGGEVEAEDGSGALQRYLQLHAVVLEFCASCDGAAAALASMEAVVKRAVGGWGCDTAFPVTVSRWPEGGLSAAAARRAGGREGGQRVATVSPEDCMEGGVYTGHLKQC